MRPDGPTGPSGGRSHGVAAALVGLALVGSLAVGATACGKDEFGDRTARVTVDGRTTGFHLDSCGLDRRTLFVVGRADDGSILQAVVGLAGDRKRGLRASTGFSVIQGPTTVEAFGSESWARRGRSGPAPGTITSARLRGARIQVAGSARSVDDNQIATGPDAVDVTIDARCDARNDRPARRAGS